MFIFDRDFKRFLLENYFKNSLKRITEIVFKETVLESTFLSLFNDVKMRYLCLKIKNIVIKGN